MLIKNIISITLNEKVEKDKTVPLVRPEGGEPTYLFRMMSLAELGDIVFKNKLSNLLTYQKDWKDSGSTNYNKDINVLNGVVYPYSKSFSYKMTDDFYDTYENEVTVIFNVEKLKQINNTFLRYFEYQDVALPLVVNDHEYRLFAKSKSIPVDPEGLIAGIIFNCDVIEPQDGKSVTDIIINLLVRIRNNIKLGLSKIYFKNITPNKTLPTGNYMIKNGEFVKAKCPWSLNF